MKFILFYRPPCGRWYVHSHKLYDSRETALTAAAKFLHPDIPIDIAPIDTSKLADLRGS